MVKKSRPDRKKHEPRSESRHVQALDMISNGLFWWENSRSDGEH